MSSSSSSPLPINPDPGPNETRVNIYGYTPWRALGIVSIILFGVGLACHIGYAIRAGVGGGGRGKRKRRQQAETEAGQSDDGTTLGRMSTSELRAHIVTFETLFSFGCALEVVGYAFRTASSANPFILINFILNYFMIVVAPVFFSAAQYYCLSIILRRQASYKSLLPLSGRAIVAIFVVADVITIIIQVVGAALIGVSESRRASGEVPPLTPEQANDILRAGLAVQVFFITVFLSLLALLIVRLTKRGRQGEGNKVDDSHTDGGGRRLPLLLSVLTVSAIFIYIRTVFRLVEAAMGVESGASLNQGLFAALETAPVFAAVILWTAVPLQFSLGV